MDERIQRFARTEYQGTVVHNIFAGTGVNVPVHTEIPLDATDLSNFTEPICEYIDRQLSGACISRYLLIHYGILERLFEKNTEAIKASLIEWSLKAKVVVTSGRGKPKDLPDRNVFFVHLSPVLNVFTEVRSKYSMNYLLNAARRTS